MVAGQHRLEGLGVLPLGMVGRHLGKSVEREEALAVERLLDPGGAVLVEGGDAVLRAPRRSAPPSVVVAATKSRIACFAAPSFQDGSGSSCARAWRPGQRARVAARVANRARRLSARGRSLAMSVSLSAAGAAERVTHARAIPGMCMISRRFIFVKIGRRRPTWAPFDAVQRSSNSSMSAEAPAPTIPEALIGCSVTDLCPPPTSTFAPAPAPTATPPSRRGSAP